MKNSIIAILVAFFSISAVAQDGKSKNKKVVFKVVGNCEMCEKRIEKAAFSVKGVKSAELNRNLWEIESNEIHDIRPDIFKFAVENNLTLLTLHEKQQNLENVFHQLTQNM